MNAPNLEIPAFLDRRPLVYSFTFLNTYDGVCPHQAYRRYILKDQPYVETPAMKWGNEVHAAFEYRLTGRKPLPATMRQWEHFAVPFDGRPVRPEQKLGIASTGASTGFFDKNVWLRGKLDVPLVNGEAAYLLDWKTGNSKYEDPFELAVGALLLHAANPQLKSIKGQYAWLKEDRLGQPYDVSDTIKTWNKVNSIGNAIEADRASGHFEKKRSPLCAWCSVADCENNTNPEIKK